MSSSSRGRLAPDDMKFPASELRMAFQPLLQNGVDVWFDKLTVRVSLPWRNGMITIRPTGIALFPLKYQGATCHKCRFHRPRRQPDTDVF